MLIKGWWDVTQQEVVVGVRNALLLLYHSNFPKITSNCCVCAHKFYIKTLSHLHSNSLVWTTFWKTIHPFCLPLIHMGYNLDRTSITSITTYSITGLTQKQTAFHTHINTHGQFRVPIWSHPHVFGLCEETRPLRGDSCRRGKNMHVNSTQKGPHRPGGLNPAPSCCEATVCPSCSRYNAVGNNVWALEAQKLEKPPCWLSP